MICNCYNTFINYSVAFDYKITVPLIHRIADDYPISHQIKNIVGDIFDYT